MKNEKLIIAICGASGAIYGIKLLEILKDLKLETHLIISKAAYITIHQETNYKVKDIQLLASYNYNENEIGARIASGSFKNSGMIIAPCSIKTMSAIAHSIELNLIIRAANVALKERRKLILMVRESPLHQSHLENMLKITNLGGIIAPPMPSFYNNPQNLEDIVKFSVLRILDFFDIETNLFKRWDGLNS